MGLFYRSTDLQDDNIKLRLVRGFFEPAIADGEDDDVLGAAGREAGTWIKVYRRILLEGHVEGTGSSLSAQQLSWHTSTRTLLDLMDRTLDAGTLKLTAGHLGIPAVQSITLSTSAAADDIIDTAAAHGLSEDDPVYFSSLTGGTGLSTDTIYYVIAANLDTQTFQVSTTKGGSAVDFSTNITAGTVKTATSRSISATCVNYAGGQIVASRFQTWTFELESISSPPDWEPAI